MSEQKDLLEMLSNLMIDMCDEKEDSKQCVRKENDEQEVSKVHDMKVDKKGNYSFLVTWKGFRTRDWVKDEDANCETLIKEYLDEYEPEFRTIYCLCRVSSKQQAGNNHVSLEAQKRLVRKTAKKKYGNTVRIKTIYVTSTAYRRIPSQIKELVDITDENDSIFIYRVDRLTRNIILFLSVLEQMNSKGVEIYSCSEKLTYGNDKLDFIQAVLNAHKEAETIGKRVKLSIDERKKRGDDVIGGQIPFGYRIKRGRNERIKLVKNPVEQKVIKEIIEKVNYNNDKISRMELYRRIANHMNSVHLLKRGKEWKASSVKYLYEKFMF
tara:strand:- start:352 stop:1323 length:972 start_codon:yes stop_codon:yes gene_type:complete